MANLLKAALHKHARDLAVGDRLTLIAFDGSAERPPSALFDRCKPASSANILVSTPALVEATFEETFAHPLEDSINAITRTATARQTNLVAFLSNIAALAAYEARATSTRIIVFSNLVENTTEFSFYAKGRTASTPATFTAYFNPLVGDRLKGITLDIYVVPSGNADLARRIKQAWTQALTWNAITFSWRQL